MAEFVQQSIEEMLPELEQMERVGIFTKTETRSILKKRKSFEYKLRRKSKQKEDYLQYIQYEINVLALIKKRREKVGYMFKKGEIEVAIIRRIHKLFWLAQERFRSDVKIWLAHIEYAKVRGEKTHVGKIFTKMLQIHNKKPELWIMAAKYEFEECASILTARHLMQRAIRFNSESKQLWLEYFRLELLNVDNLKKRQEILGVARNDDEPMEEDENVSDAVMQGKVAEVVFRNGTEKYPDDVEFVIQFLEIAKLFNFTHNFVNTIYEGLESRHKNSEIMWDLLACHCLDRKIVAEDKKQKVQNILAMEEECYLKYEEAVKILPTVKMWDLYLRTCIKRLQRKSSAVVSESRLLQTLHVFQAAYNCKLLSAEMFSELINILVGMNDVTKACKIAEIATACYDQSHSLWHVRLILLIKSEKSEEEIKAVFDEAITKINEKEQLSLWEVMINWLKLTKSEQIIDFFEIAIVKNSAISVPFKELYLDWMNSVKGQKQTRKLYKRLASVKPVSLQFYRNYIKFEKKAADMKVKMLRRGYEDAVNDHGKTDIDIWLDFMTMEDELGNDPTACSKLHWRAMKTLESSLIESFITRYTLRPTVKKILGM